MKLIKGTVKVTFGSGDSERIVEREVTYNEVENADDVLAILQNEDQAKDFFKSANYGINLRARSIVSAAIKDTESGPEKAIEKMVKDMIKARAALGRPITEANAIAKVKEMLG